MIADFSVYESRKGEYFREYQNICRRIEERESYQNSENVQAFINNCKCVPVTMEQLYEVAFIDGIANIDDLLYADVTSWTVPKWAKSNDIVFFMVQKEVTKEIAKVRREVLENKDDYDIDEYIRLMAVADRYMELANRYHGQIIAIGRVDGGFEVDSDVDIAHWKANVYADINDINVLKHPLGISEFNDFIRVSRQSAITGVFGRDFEKLRSLLRKNNKLPGYLNEATASPLPYKEINKETWLSIANEYRRSFMLEAQFRKYYVDFLLDELKDKRTKVYAECACHKGNNPTTYVDNVIQFGGRYLMVEVKLNVNATVNLCGQVNQYCNVDSCTLSSKESIVKVGSDFYENNVLVIDTEKVYMFDAKSNMLSEVFSLDELHSREDIQELHRIVAKQWNVY